MTTPSGPAPSGEQWTIRHGDWEAIVCEVGGGLRSLTKGGVDVIAGFTPEDRITAARGQQLIPFPGRVRDGRYRFDGVDHQLPLTDVETGNASHGLVRWASWSPEGGAHGEDEVTLVHRLHPCPGWDWTLDLATTYALDDDGLTVTWRATNLSAQPAPFGYAAHPYLFLGDTPLEQVRLTIPAERYLTIDAERLLPSEEADVAGTDFDFREERALGETEINNPMTGMATGPDGLWRVRLRGVPAGEVSLWADAAHGWAVVYTGRARASTEGTTGLAVEPQTCPPDALNSGVDLQRLAPGASTGGRWGISA